MFRNKLPLIIVLLLAVGLCSLQILFMSRVKDPATLQKLQEAINEYRDPREPLILRPGVWKTGWFLSGRIESLDILKDGGRDPLLTLRQLRFDLDLLPSLLKACVHIQWDAREKQSGAMLKGQMELRLTDLLPQSFQMQSGALPIETMIQLFPERVRSSQWLSGLQGRLRIDGRGSWEQGEFEVEIPEIRWRTPGTRLPLLSGGRARTRLAYAHGQWSFQPPLSFKDGSTGLVFQLDYEQNLRLTLNGPPLLITALAQSQRCPIGSSLVLHWTSQGFVCR
jgi:hypothetical protein